MTVLMVDDDPVGHVLFAESLAALGHEAVLAPDGNEAWNKPNKEF